MLPLLYSYFTESCILVYLIYGSHYIIFSWTKALLYYTLVCQSLQVFHVKIKVTWHCSFHTFRCSMVWLGIRLSFLTGPFFGHVDSLHRCWYGLCLVSMKPVIFIAASKFYYNIHWFVHIFKFSTWKSQPHGIATFILFGAAWSLAGNTILIFYWSRRFIA